MAGSYGFYVIVDPGSKAEADFFAEAAGLGENAYSIPIYDSVSHAIAAYGMVMLVYVGDIAAGTSQLSQAFAAASHVPIAWDIIGDVDIVMAAFNDAVVKLGLTRSGGA